MKSAIIWDERFAEHDTGGHVERPDRAGAVVGYLNQSDIWPRIELLKPAAASIADILRVHTSDYVASIEKAAAAGGTWLDADTYVSRRSFDIALLAAGGGLDVATQWERGIASFALVRPPGHHALPDRAMGFCLFNNVAVLARKLLEQGVERIAILDWDVHHGNGTQAAFWDEPRVLFVSLHQWPHYPGSGWYDECGEGDGEGLTVNLPLPAGSCDGDYVHAFANLVEPIVGQFDPQAVLVSAGLDIHVDDPLGSMRVTESGFAQLALRAAGMAARSASGRLGLLLEGGYDRAATGRAVEACLRAMLDEAAPAVGEPTRYGQVAVKRAIDTQKRYWEL